jgi:phosphomannomutase
VDRISAAERPIRFGTSGWRGPLGEEVTFPRLRVLVRSLADWIVEQGRGDRVLIGWDNRFSSEEMARTVASVLVESGLRPILSATPAPTPAITTALARGRFAAGLMLTASHNPAADHGLKVFADWGGAIPDTAAARIEAIAAARMRDDAPATAEIPRRRANVVESYSRLLAAQLDLDALRRSPLTVFYDAMHGSGGGVLDAVLESAGVPVERLRCDRDATFGGVLPDPTAEHLRSLSARVEQGKGLRLGLATDGDGDRLGAVDGQGRVLNETQVIALLIDVLARKKRLTTGVGISIGTGSLAAKVAAFHGLAVERHPVGFKHLATSLRSGSIEVAGEESGGFAWSEMGFDKDGLLAGCLLVDLVAQTGQPLECHVQRLEEQFGISACGRTAIPRTARIERALERLANSPPVQFGRARVSEVSTEGCLRLGLSDGGFLILRASGTEPLVRVYAEASSAAALSARLRAGIRLVEALSKSL